MYDIFFFFFSFWDEEETGHLQITRRKATTITTAGAIEAATRVNNAKPKCVKPHRHRLRFMIPKNS